jgi:hypothetical protein
MGFFVLCVPFCVPCVSTPFSRQVF